MPLVPPIRDQQQYWNQWNSAFREGRDYDSRTLDAESQRRGEAVLERLRSLELASPSILEVGCGAGWLSGQLARLGSVTGVDLADEVIARARSRFPTVSFYAGDVMTLPLPAHAFDATVCLETLSHVADQRGFLGRIAELLKVGGYLLLTTQNRFIYERRNDVNITAAPIARYLTPLELRRLLSERYAVQQIDTIIPAGHRGLLRLINSYKLEHLLAHIVPPAAITRLKESLGLGTTIVALARTHPVA